MSGLSSLLLEAIDGQSRDHGPVTPSPRARQSEHLRRSEVMTTRCHPAGVHRRAGYLGVLPVRVVVVTVVPGWGETIAPSITAGAAPWLSARLVLPVPRRLPPVGVEGVDEAPTRMRPHEVAKCAQCQRVSAAAGPPPQ